jgi:CheY-like chemotaxis protein
MDIAHDVYMASVLVVDDNPIFLHLTREVLERAGHRVVEAVEGPEALRPYAQRPADVVVCDLFMPLVDGQETIRELRRTSRVPIIAITGEGQLGGANVLDLARKMGADRALAKPFVAETLLGMIRNLLPGSE